MTKICDECGDKHYAKGKCKQHYKMPSQLNPKPIRKGTSIGNYTMINKAITAPKKSKAIPKVSQKQLDRLKAYKKVRDAFMKEHEYCQAQLEGICLGKATDTHHSKGKVGDLLTDVRYFVALCRACHSKIEVSPNLAKELGFSLNRLDK